MTKEGGNTENARVGGPNVRCCQKASGDLKNAHEHNQGH